ncbi:MAG: bifunctional diaminohydroxyphosphoribosylaminopyrimidine deaminase/5-amino-6-(5-phosphoribosylamino)uracil reductase RibD, partial [Methylophilaceae bacterium]|nr:bifunctional diaminohydroxyphosphoribosylaminopyrimidine deaminase/5-amino-6-(5-phosphoribosylamino)uracil reductase RibD [Methylophilaceae bacterium]
MTQALRLAEEGLYTTQPNPRVGCVVVRDAVIVGMGAHHKAGEAHAEIMALQAAGQRARGASLYVNLEPCAHFGRTPPCVDAIIAAGVKRVVVAMQDANPLVAGAGIARLRAANIRVDMNLMHSPAQALNAGFTRRMTQQRPLVRSKIAASLDGRTALNNKTSQWITGEAARHDVQHWRARSCALITGVETVLIDNPQLISRLPNLSRQPLRVVLDSHLRTPIHAQILRPEICQQSPLLIAYAQAHPPRIKALAQAGAHLIALPNHDGRVDLAALMTYLATQQQVNEVWVEAGA